MKKDHIHSSDAAFIRKTRKKYNIWIFLQLKRRHLL